MRRPLLLLLVTLFALFPTSATTNPPPLAPNPLLNPSPFGMNLYITGLERPDAEARALVARAREIGVAWSREELSWANLEGNWQGGWASYDARLQLLQDAGINVIGMLLTTPSWASGVSEGEDGWYWYPPRDPQAYGDFVERAVRRWRDKVQVWELWNEPDKDGTWRPRADPAAYARLLAAGYAAVKRADPNALVMAGSVYVHDANNEGLAFMEQVVAASGGQLNFDLLGIHTFMNDRPPEDTVPVTLVQNLPWRIQKTKEWLAGHGQPAMPIWVTEDGAGVCSPCNGLGTSEQYQAARLVRRYMLALQNGAAQFDYFQMKDKFNGKPDDVYGNMSIMRNDLSPRPAYFAYKTMTGLLAGARYQGPGSLQRAVANQWQPQYDRYHLVFNAAGGPIHVLWLPEGVAAQEVSLPVTRPRARIVQLDGTSQDSPPKGGLVTVRLTSSPIFVVEETPPPPDTLDPAADPGSPTGYRPSARFQEFWQQYGGLPTFGYAISPERQEFDAGGQGWIVQWFERNRFEWHPEKPAPFKVELGHLGRALAAGRTFPTIPAFTSTAERWYVPETGHSLGGSFLQYWQAGGGLPLYGYPISEPFPEQNPSDGQTYTVQYFERARFELHPANTPPYDVLLGLLGRQLYRP